MNSKQDNQGIGIEAVSHQRWNTLCARFRDANHRQLWEFGEACAERIGARSEHIAFIRDGEIIGLADVRVKTIPVVGGGIAYINGGPLVRRDDDDEQSANTLGECLGALEDIFARRRGYVLRIQPSASDSRWNEILREVLVESGWTCAASARAEKTIMLDIDRSLERIRAGFKQKWRNCLNASERSDVRLVSGTGRELFGEFVRLYEEMHIRKGFEVDLDASFYARVQEGVAEGGRFIISLAYLGSEPVAGHVASVLGETAVYLLGAANGVGRKTKAAYQLQWYAIQQAQQNGCLQYDLGGIDATANPGVYRFKRGLGGEEMILSGSFEYALRSAHRLVTIGAERTYKTLRDLRKKMGRERRAQRT